MGKAGDSGPEGVLTTRLNFKGDLLTIQGPDDGRSLTTGVIRHFNLTEVTHGSRFLPTASVTE